jgi:dienelactone hydrolase
MHSHISFCRLWLVLCAASILTASVVASAAGVHPLFNVQSTTQAPFPSDRFTVVDFDENTFLRVNMPFPDCGSHPSDCLDVVRLNELDGFNTQPRLSIPFDGAIDPSTVNSHTVFLVRLGNLFGASDAPPSVVGINQVVWDPASLTLFAESDQHLDQHTSYLLLVTNGIHDDSGAPIEISPNFDDFRNNLNFGQTKDPQLKLYREILISSLRNGLLEAVAHVSRKNVVAASVFTTGTVSSTLEKIRNQIKAAPAPAVTFNLGLGGERTVFPVASVAGILFTRDRPSPGNPATNFVPTPALQVFPGSVASIAFGKFNAMNFETTGSFIPAVPTRTGVPAVQGTQDIYFNLFVPAGPKPNGGWPVAIFGHGFGDNKNNSPFAVASTLAHFGIATIAINAVGHGFGPNGTLAVFQNNGTTTVLRAGGRGVLQNGDTTFASTEGLFATGAHADLATRDGIQETVADLMQVVRAIQGGVDVNGDGMPALDPNRIYYFGQSLGGIYGTVFLGVEPDVRAGVPNVPGGSLTDIARLSPNFQPLLALFLLSRVPSLLNGGPNGFTDDMPLRNQPPVIAPVPGAIAIQTFLDNANWLQQAGDPVPWAAFVRRRPLPGDAA